MEHRNVRRLSAKQSLKGAADENTSFAHDFYINNCINHVIRPLQQAGAKIDFGEIATPKELCIWCDSVCLNGAGFCLNETEYQKLLTQLDAKEHNKQIIEKLYAFSKLKNISLITLNDELKTNIAIMLSIKGPILRTRSFEEGMV